MTPERGTQFHLILGIFNYGTSLLHFTYSSLWVLFIDGSRQHLVQKIAFADGEI